MMERWQAAKRIVSLRERTSDQLREVAMVVRGHTWDRANTNKLTYAEIVAASECSLRRTLSQLLEVVLATRAQGRLA